MKKKILLTGATGYVGGLLLERLISAGHEIHVLARSPEKVVNRPGVEIFKGDIRDHDSIASAMKDCQIAYYLVHGLNTHFAFEYEESRSAQTFTAAANEAKLEKIIYLGGLGEEGGLSPHLRSRQLTGKILALGKTPVTEFRASVVLGRGSTSYEMMRLLAQRLPFFIDPSNLRALCQPLAEQDLISYLMLELGRASGISQVFELGGKDRCTYSGLLVRLAQHSGIKRQVIPAMEIDLRLLAEVFELICPEYARVGRHLMESLTYPTVQNEKATTQQAFPEVKPIGIEEALDRIGQFHADPRELLTKDHLLKIFRGLRGRFPRWPFTNWPRSLLLDDQKK
ncbi:MAG: NAD(P)H-binding protein [Bdellovibrionales bacterium]|nr:NAD(P)H-binding protein [Bdellovibrionales bacterium]